MMLSKNILLVIGGLVMLSSCKKDEFENPYDEYTTAPLYTNQSALASLPTDNFAYLQNKVFGPTCANSGCHDGAFEPDFRTISSSYNTLVYQPVITNDPGNSFTYRVAPNNAFGSLLHERLIFALPNTSGQMPLVSNSGWEANKTSYINSIKSWINNGAKDMFGNPAVIGNPHPTISGFHAYADGNTTTPYNRANGTGVLPIVIPPANVDLWFNITDDATLPANFTVNEVKISDQQYGFEGVAPQVMTTPASITGQNFNNNSVQFTHKLDFDASIYPSGTILYVRVYVQDEDHTEPVESPNEGSAKQVLFLFSLFVN